MRDIMLGLLAGFIIGITLAVASIAEENYEPIEKNASGMYLTHDGKLYKLVEVACE